MLPKLIKIGLVFFDIFFSNKTISIINDGAKRSILKFPIIEIIKNKIKKKNCNFFLL